MSNDTQVGTILFQHNRRNGRMLRSYVFSAFSHSSYLQIHIHMHPRQVVWFYLATLFKSNHGVRYNPSYPIPILPDWVLQHCAKPQFGQNKLFTISMKSRAFAKVMINLYLTTYNICPIPFSYQQHIFLRTSAKLWLLNTTFQFGLCPRMSLVSKSKYLVSSIFIT